MLENRGEVLVLAQACRDGLNVGVAHVRTVVEATHAVRRNRCVHVDHAVRRNRCVHVDHVEHPFSYFELIPSL